MTPRITPLAKRLRGMREAAGLTQEQLAPLAGIDQPHIARIELGHLFPVAGTIRAWARATGHERATDDLLEMLADAKAAEARAAVEAAKAEQPGWCRAHHQERSRCRPDQAHVYSYRARGDLMAGVEEQARKEGLTASAFVTRALENAVILSREGNLANAEAPDAPSPSPAPRRAATARTGASKGKNAAREGEAAAPAEASAPVAAENAKATVVEQLREQAEQIAPGTVMFQEPGADKHVTHPVPEPRRSAKKGLQPESASDIAEALRNRRNGGQR